MFCELLQGIDYCTSRESEIYLDDEFNGSEAVYHLSNPNNIMFEYFMPEEYEDRNCSCDYILTTNVGRNTTRYIELKGDEAQRDSRCCESSWQHAFHQIYNTIVKYEDHLAPNEKLKAILCTSRDRPSIRSRFKGCVWYKKVHNKIGEEPMVLYAGDIDTHEQIATASE